MEAEKAIDGKEKGKTTRGSLLNEAKRVGLSGLQNLDDAGLKDAIEKAREKKEPTPRVAKVDVNVRGNGKLKPRQRVKRIQESKGKPKDKAKAEKSPRKETEKSRYEHRSGSQAAMLDDLFFKGSTLEDAAEKVGSSTGRCRGHVKHLIEKHKIKIEEKDGIFKVLK